MENLAQKVTNQKFTIVVNANVDSPKKNVKFHQ
jgi:hypothetical protein